MNIVEDTIRETKDENRKNRDKIVNGKLEALKIQSDHFKQFAESSRGYKNREYEAFEKITKIQADRIRD